MESHSTYVIAEAGVNHNGSLNLAKELIDVAAEAGADAVKFQTFKAEEVISRNAPKAAYQTKTTSKQESQLEMVKKLELSAQSHRMLIEHCAKRKIQFLSTPFDLSSVDFLDNVLDLPRIKIPSGEITNGPLLLKIAQTGKPVILSTGMSTLGEIEIALGVLAFGYLKSEGSPSLKNFEGAYFSEEGQKNLQDRVSLLHCTTEYPAPFADVNLRAIDTLRQAFGLPVGLSDHTVGIAVPIAAVARGASIIEKHFTLDKNLPGPDHKASLEPGELRQMVISVRQVEKALGNGRKRVMPSELPNRDIARKSLVASICINKSDLFSGKNLCAKRPGVGVSPMLYWDYLGRIAKKDYQIDELIEHD